VVVSARTGRAQAKSTRKHNPSWRPIFSSTSRSGIPQERAGEPLNETTNLIPHPPIMSQGLLWACRILRQFWRIVESYMNDLRFSRKYGAILIGVAADGHYVIEINVLESVNVLGLVMGEYRRLIRPYGLIIAEAG